MKRPRRVLGLRILKRLPSAGPGFLTLERYLAKNVYADGVTSRAYRFEVVHRRGIDAVAIVPFYFEGTRPARLFVVIKIGFRPGLYLRSRLALPLSDRRAYLFVREAVAGSLEPSDRGLRGIDARARKELFEETGLRPKGRIIRLGAGFFPSHGQSTERVHLRAFEVEPGLAREAPGDGSVNEQDSGTVALEAHTILKMCRRGLIEDPKIEVGVRRLCDLVGDRLRSTAPQGTGRPAANARRAAVAPRRVKMPRGWT